MDSLELNSNISEPEQTYFADVVVPLALPGTYTYRIPRDLVAYIEAGKRVTVQFGKRRLYAAIVFDIHTNAPEAYAAKYITEILDTKPLLTEQQLHFWQWLSRYYMCTLGEVMHAALPAFLKLESESTISGNFGEAIDYESLTDREYLIVEALEMAPQLTISDISNIVHLKNVFPLIRTLHEKGLVKLHEELPKKYQPKLVTFVKLHDSLTSEESLKEAFDKLERAPKQLDILMSFISLQETQESVSRKQLLQASGATSNTLNALISKEYLETFEEQVDRFEATSTPLDSFELNSLQQQKLQEIKEAFEAQDICLLHGVTASGKTHIYVRLIEDALQESQQVLYLVPEIALTSQLIERMRRYFGDSAIVFHSKFSENERVELWQKVASREAKVVLGARSAVFLPFQDLGLVIVDEEHESSFKQQDPNPRYHGRDAAIYLAGLWKSKTLLGSATPSFESYHNAIKHKYGFVEIQDRFGDIPLPEIELIDLREQKRKRKMSSVFSWALLEEMKTALAQQEQIILFQNRRGYVPIIECQVCNWTPMCINCDISLTYHKNQNILKCHYCGYKHAPFNACESCGSTLLEMHGFGTEKIEDELSILLPEANIQRLDLDTTRTKHGHRTIIKDFEDRRIDILVGTQMITKGLDFSNVSLVGILNADLMLNYPDFRSFERAFQLIVQVSGRAGRKHKQGKVLIQTHHPDHQVLQNVIHNRYVTHYQNEMFDRQKFNYPPYFRLIHLSIKHKDAHKTSDAARALAAKLKAQLGKRVLGPESPPVARVRNQYIQQILLKIEKESINLSKLKTFIHSEITLLKAQIDFKSVQVQIDVDPA